MCVVAVLLLGRASCEDTILLATGSVDSHVYVYDVGGPTGSSQMIQKLRGSNVICFAGFTPSHCCP